MDRIPDLLLSALRVFAAMSPWLVAGFFAAGVLAVWIPRAWVNRALGGRTGLSGVLRAVLVGVPLPICSCGVLPIAAGLRRNGAGKGATAAFLISTPQTGVDSILATYALMGPVFAVARPLAAALTGLVGGAVVAAVGGEDDAVASAAEEPPPPSRGLREILRQAYVRLLGSVAKPLAAGLAVSALVTVLIPDGFFAEAFGGRDWLAMPAMALVGLPMYVCSTASIPIAASLMLKGVSPGAAFVMVGPAMNAVSVTTVAALIGRRATAAYVATIVVGAILCGCAVNAFADPSAAVEAARCASHGLTPLHWACAAFLAAMTAYNLARPAAMTSRGRAGEAGGCCGGSDGCCGGGAAASAPEPAPAKGIGPVVATCELALDGLRCMNCVAHAKKALEAIPGVAADVTLDPQRALVRMDRDVPESALRAAVEGEGYRVVSVSRR